MNYFLNLDGLYKKNVLSKNAINHAHKHKHNPKHIQRKAAEKINLDGNFGKFGKLYFVSSEEIVSGI